MSFKSALSAAACAAALACAASPALADVTWMVSGTFDDGGTLSGWFDINVYGYLEDFDLVTTAGSTVTPGYDYNKSDSYFSNGTFFVDAQPGYQQDLHLSFLNSIDTGSHNPLVGGLPGPGNPDPSYECVGSFSCFDLQGGTTRFLTAGLATVPEPAAWTMMIAGFGLAGAALRRRRSAQAAA